MRFWFHKNHQNISAFSIHSMTFDYSKKLQFINIHSCSWKSHILKPGFPELHFVFFVALNSPCSAGHCFIENCWVDRSILVSQGRHSRCCFTGRLKKGFGCKVATSWAATSDPLCLTDTSKIQLRTPWYSGTIPSAWYTSQSGSLSSRISILGSAGSQLHCPSGCVEELPVSKLTIQSSCTVAGSSQE